MPPRPSPSVLHVDLDAFFAAVEQRDKPSLRGRPVVVGGVGGRGAVATASYEARAYGVRSAIPTATARALCPHAAYLSPRFPAYAAVSAVVMAALREWTPLVEPLSLDEAFLDLAPDGDHPPVDRITDVARAIKDTVHERTGMVASVGAGTSKLVAKIASDLDKPDGLLVVAAGEELGLLAGLPVTRLWGVGPATAERLRRLGVTTVAELREVGREELVGLLGNAHGAALWHQARAEDDRPVVPERESKSVSAEETFERDLTEPALLVAEVERLAGRVVDRLRRDGQSGRTVTLKLRRYDFSTLSRSTTVPGPTDDARTVSRIARQLLAEIDTTGGVRLLGVGVSGLTDWAQSDLFDQSDLADLADLADQSDGSDLLDGSGLDDGDGEGPSGRPGRAALAPVVVRRPGAGWSPGQDVEHDGHGRGWVWGSGAGRVTVRFETAETGPGPVRTFAADDPGLRRVPPLVRTSTRE